MDPLNPEELLKDESFISFCHNRQRNDVEYWQNFLKDNPDQQLMVRQLKALVLSLSFKAAENEANKNYDRLRIAIKDRSVPYGQFKIKHFRNHWFVAAAAAILLFTATFLYIKLRDPIVTNYSANKRADITSGGNKAVLTLANGQKIDLTSARSGLVVQRNGVDLTKTGDGQLVYSANSTLKKAIEGNNTIETPAKGQYMVVLSDGTKVWLNAKSKLVYPVAFNGGGIRQVSLTGEGYFEVAHLTNGLTGEPIPFIVNATSPEHPSLDQRIEVLGTHFNVSCYDDDKRTVTTLLTGKVRVTKPSASGHGDVAVLSPGRELITGDQLFKQAAADVGSAVAWKNGDFVFRENVSSALRKVSRWYDVDIVYSDDAPKQLNIGGWISRKNNISEILNLMESTGKIHLKLEGRRVLVSK